MNLESVDIDSIKTLDEALAVIKLLMIKVSELERENAELKAKVAELSKDSSTSSKPPSSDIVKPKHQRRQRGKRQRGAQKGHQGVYRELLPPQEVDRVEELKADVCPECGHRLEAAPEVPPLRQQVIELPEKPREVTEYRRGAGYCPCCQSTQYAALPDGVIEGQVFGARLQALMGYMKGKLGASYTELAQFCEDVLGVRVCTGHLANVVQRVSEALKAPYEELHAQLPSQPSLNVDETGWSDMGVKYWVWIFCNPLIAFFTIQASRGSRVLKEVLGETFPGARISDFYSAYVCFASPRQQFCLAHLIRDIKFLTTLPDEATKDFGKVVLKHFKRLFALWHERERWSPEEFQGKVKCLQRTLFSYLHSQAIPPGKATTMKKRLVKHWDSLFRFVKEPELYEPTNNLAEQTLRPLIRLRNHTQGSRSAWGRMWTARIMTVLQTCRKQHKNAWHFIQQSVTAYYFHSTPPSLLPTT